MPPLVPYSPNPTSALFRLLMIVLAVCLWFFGGFTPVLAGFEGYSMARDGVWLLLAWVLLIAAIVANQRGNGLYFGWFLGASMVLTDSLGG